MTKYTVSKPELVLLVHGILLYSILAHFCLSFLSIVCRLETYCISKYWKSSQSNFCCLRTPLLFFTHTGSWLWIRFIKNASPAPSSNRSAPTTTLCSVQTINMFFSTAEVTSHYSPDSDIMTEWFMAGFP